MKCKIGAIVGVALLAGCQGQSGDGIVTADEAEVFDAIGPDETVQFTGTEPFWGGDASEGQLRYTTPENIDGVVIPVDRFAGNNGLSFSGSLEGADFDMTVTPGDCSDGMSDRTYPFVATLQIGEETRSGCAWTQGMPFTGPAAP